MKKVIMLMLVVAMIGFTSCEKIKECNCGKVTDKFKMIVDGSDIGMPFIQYKGKVKYITVENNCTKKEIEVKLTEKEVKEIKLYDTWCSTKRKDWK